MQFSLQRRLCNTPSYFNGAVYCSQRLIINQWEETVGMTNCLIMRSDSLFTYRHNVHLAYTCIFNKHNTIMSCSALSALTIAGYLLAGFLVVLGLALANSHRISSLLYRVRHKKTCP